MSRSPFRPSRSVALLALALVGASCGGDKTPASTAQAATSEVQVAREMAAAYFSKDEKGKARDTLAPLVAKSDAALEDLVDAAVVELALADVNKAKPFLDRAAKLDAKDAALNYCLGRLAELQADQKTAAVYFRKAVEAAPKDAPAKLHLSDALEDSDPKECESLRREVIAAGVDQNGPWYRSALYKLAMLLRSDDKSKDEWLKLLAQTNELEGRGIKAPQAIDYDMGNLGRVRAPAPNGNKPGASHMPEFGPVQTICPEFAGATDIFASDLDNDGRLDLVGYGPKGLVVGLQRDGFKWDAQSLSPSSVDRAIAFDLGNDDDMDLLFAHGGELHLLEATIEGTPPKIAWHVWPGKLPVLPSTPSDMLAVDYDHEGDLDLLFVGEFGARLLRDDGARLPEKGGYTDVTSDAHLPTDKGFEWCVSEDFDTDQDVDLLFGGAKGLYLASNLRGGKFEDLNANVASVAPSSFKPVVADLDGDGRPDLYASAPQKSTLHKGQPSGSFANGVEGGWSLNEGDSVAVVDLDLDGAADVVRAIDGFGNRGVRADLGVGVERRQVFVGSHLKYLMPMLIDDIDGDLAWDLISFSDTGVEVQRGTQKDAHAIRLGFRGKKDNRRAVGAIVEVRAGDVYRRIYWRGENQLVGVGDAKEVDFVRITWPNGVVQYDTRRELGDRVATKENPQGLQQSDALGGSCPFLYTWNGSKFVFVTDVLGITPLGLPFAPGQFVPPDHDEYVLVRGDQLAPKDGVYELQFTEELREVTYLDRIRLDVVDSPIGVEIYPNELFSFPPFPQAHTHTVRAPLAPTKATGSDGKDWTSALAKIDDDYAAPFTPIERQFKGLATPHWLELEFDPAAVKNASKLRLVMTGWFFWTDASVNMAAAYDPDNHFEPPVLQLPDGHGGWKDSGPPIGFPAGKTKSMVIDVTQLLDRENPKLRFASSLRLYWDSIRLAVDNDDAELDVRSLEAASAQLWRRGFSAPEEPLEPFQPERFTWEHLAEFPRWNQHPGQYTKYGETLPLLSKIDDEFVILGSGDALTVKFDAKSLPPPRAGFKRDYLVFLDGWAKDRDPNTVQALYVEPLPFHAMSGYPYREDEHFPDDSEHMRWRREWNTRPAYRWLDEFVVR
jgi:hypothetical protein